MVKRQLKRSAQLVRLKRWLWATTELQLHLNEQRVIDRLPIFAPFSGGSIKARADLTVQAAEQTFPFLADLVATLEGAEFEAPVAIESLADTASKAAAAAQLKTLFDKYGSDKSTYHDYHHAYGSILADPDSVTDLLEVGLGTNNPEVVSNMSREGRPGASLFAYRDFLPNARIYGADIDRDILFEDERISTFFVDQTSPRSFDPIAAALPQEFDLIIDDGLHSPNANIATMAFALGKLKKGGWFVVEDISPAAVPVWRVISTLLPDRFKPQLVAAREGLLFLVERSR
jgi:hypothetical protein